MSERSRTHGLVPALLSVTVACGAAVDVPSYGAADEGPSVVLSNADGRNAYTGVARLQGRATCSAALLDAGAGAGAPAYVLTNGHCSTTFGSNELALDQPAPSSYAASFGLFADTPAALHVVPVRRIAFSSMKGTDLSLMELPESAF